MKYFFGQKGIWRKPASEQSKAKRMKARVLEQTPEGLLYIFTDEPMVKGANNLTYRTATIFPSDFDVETDEVLVAEPKKIQKYRYKEGTELPKVSIHCPIHSKTVCVGIKNGIMCKRCFDKLSTKEREKVV